MYVVNPVIWCQINHIWSGNGMRIPEDEAMQTWYIFSLRGEVMHAFRVVERKVFYPLVHSPATARAELVQSWEPLASSRPPKDLNHPLLLSQTIQQRAGFKLRPGHEPMLIRGEALMCLADVSTLAHPQFCEFLQYCMFIWHFGEVLIWGVFLDCIISLF